MVRFYLFGLWTSYTKFLTKLDGIYYLDPPFKCIKNLILDHMKPDFFQNYNDRL